MSTRSAENLLWGWISIYEYDMEPGSAEDSSTVLIKR